MNILIVIGKILLPIIILFIIISILSLLNRIIPEKVWKFVTDVDMWVALFGMAFIGCIVLSLLYGIGNMLWMLIQYVWTLL